MEQEIKEETLKHFDRCFLLLDNATQGLEITNQFVKMPQVDKVLDYLQSLRNELPLAYKKFILDSLTQVPSKLYCYIGDKIIEVSCQEYKEPIPETSKRKWYNFFPKNKTQ